MVTVIITLGPVREALSRRIPDEYHLGLPSRLVDLEVQSLEDLVVAPEAA